MGMARAVQEQGKAFTASASLLLFIKSAACVSSYWHFCPTS